MEALKDLSKIGKRVAIIGAGGIGFDVAESLIHPTEISEPQEITEFLKDWGIDEANEHRGGLLDNDTYENHNPREIFLMQRKESKLGASLGKTTGWIHRLSLKKAGVNMLRGVEYKKITPDGILISIKGEERLLK